MKLGMPSSEGIEVRMKKMLGPLVGILFACAIHGDATGYELATHSRLTYRALLQSETYLDPTTVVGLGLARGWATLLGDTYLDAQGSIAEWRSVQPFDSSRDKMPATNVLGIALDQYRTRPEGWLMSGAVREDDAGWGTQYANNHIFDAEPEPHDDPWGNFNRFCNHFFDPYRNRAFTGTCPSPVLASAPIWALGVTGPFAVPLTTSPDGSRRNHFTVVDAREAMWQALTGRDSAGSVVAADAAARLQRWATMFRALGDVLHLNQDMAQPQHTRDESHGAGHAAWYEKYVDGRAKGLTRITYEWPLGRLTAGALEPLQYGGYPIPSLPSLPDYWSTGLGGASFSGRGLADYSSRGFFTPARNFGNADYPLPPSDGSYRQTVVERGDHARDVYLDRQVDDSLLSQASRMIHMTRTSILDDFTSGLASQYGEPLPSKTYSIDRAVFDDRAELLIPRAVGYSAGILDHFFRGKLLIGPPDEGVYAMVDHAVEKAKDTDGFAVIRANVVNATRDDEPMSSGRIVAVLQYHTDDCYTADLSAVPATAEAGMSCRSGTEQMTVSAPIDLPSGLPTTATQFAFDFQKKLPINATDIRLQVVYRGRLGNEPDALAVGAKDLSEPTYFAYHNATDYIHIAGKVYTREEVNSGSNEQGTLLSQVSPQSCVDYALSPPALKPQCFQPVTMNMTLASGERPVLATITGLPVRRFSRLALLAEGATSTLDQVVVACLPATPFYFNNLRWQLNADPYTGSLSWRLPAYGKLRGIDGWVQTSCVLNGDGATLDSFDNRAEAMSDVPDRFPVAITIER